MMAVLRSINESDAMALLEIWQASATWDPLTLSVLREKLWEDVDYHPDFELAAVEDNQIAGFGVGVCRTFSGQTVGYLKMMAVAPELQRKGIGTSIYGQLEDRLRQAGVNEIRLAESAPNYLTPGIDRRYESALSFFAKQGFEEQSTARNMRVDLDAWHNIYAPKATGDQTADDVQIVRATGEHLSAVRSFINEHWPTWWSEVRNAIENDPGTLFIAIDEGRVIGFAAHDANNRGTGWFGPMGTSHAARNRGVGGRLLAKCLEDMRHTGLQHAIIPWVGPVDFYRQQCGAVLDREFARLSKKLTE